MLTALIFGTPLIAVIALLLRNKYLILLAALLSLPVAWYITSSPILALRILAMSIPAVLVFGGYLIHKQRFNLAYIALIPMFLIVVTFIAINSDWPERRGQPQAIQR